MKVASILIVTFLFSVPVQADEREIADKVSWATVVAQVTLDTIHSAKSENKKLAFARQGLRLGMTITEAELLKHYFPAPRPDGSDNKTFPSEHSAIAATSQGWNVYVGIPLTGATMAGRYVGKKHRIVDVVTGAALGSLNALLTSRLLR